MVRVYTSKEWMTGYQTSNKLDIIGREKRKQTDNKLKRWNQWGYKSERSRRVPLKWPRAMEIRRRKTAKDVMNLLLSWTFALAVLIFISRFSLRKIKLEVMIEFHWEKQLIWPNISVFPFLCRILSFWEKFRIISWGKKCILLITEITYGYLTHYLERLRERTLKFPALMMIYWYLTFYQTNQFVNNAVRFVTQ